jgi:hypothetical protein
MAKRQTEFLSYRFPVQVSPPPEPSKLPAEDTLCSLILVNSILTKSITASSFKRINQRYSLGVFPKVPVQAFVCDVIIGFFPCNMMSKKA